MGYYDNDGNYIPTDDEEFLNGDVPIRSEEEEQYILDSRINMTRLVLQFRVLHISQPV